MTLTCTNVTLRQKPLRNDRISLYLDYYPAIRNPYTMKMSRREFLGIYIYAKPKNEQQRMFNQDMLNKAEAIRCIRVQSLINEEFGFLDKNKQKVDFLAYFRTKAREKYEKWDCVYNHFEKFVGGKCTFGDVTVELCEKFRDYLLKCKQINHPNAYISRNSAAGYYSTFRALLKIAYKEKMLRENLNDFLEKIEWKEVKKEYLTLDEVKKLAATPCKIPVLKQASLFACMTGLRISDILKLDWRDFEVGPDQGYYIRICTEKTETEATLPISQEALELCGEWGTGKVFKGLTRSMTHHPLKQWIAEAGIRKHITFHDDGHTNIITNDGLKNNRTLEIENRNLNFQDGTFDLIMTNPPFGSTIKADEVGYYKEYELFEKNLGFTEIKDRIADDNNKNKWRASQSTEVLFLERCYKYLNEENGYLAIVVPDGILTNSSSQYVRDWLIEKFRILAVVSLPQHTFAHVKAGVKSSILFLKKHPKALTQKFEQTLTDIKTIVREEKGLDKEQRARRMLELYKEHIFKYSDNYEVLMVEVNNIGYDPTGVPIVGNELPVIAEKIQSFIQKENEN